MNVSDLDIEPLASWLGLHATLGVALLVAASANAWLGDPAAAAAALLLGVGNLLAAASVDGTRPAAGESRTARRPVIGTADEAPTGTRPAGGDARRPADD